MSPQGGCCGLSPSSHRLWSWGRHCNWWAVTLSGQRSAKGKEKEGSSGKLAGTVIQALGLYGNNAAPTRMQENISEWAALPSSFSPERVLYLRGVPSLGPTVRECRCFQRAGQEAHHQSAKQSGPESVLSHG